jgi:uroporphyrinogen-III synthase
VPVFAVGRQTAAAAQAAGFTRVETAGGSWPDLVRLIADGLKRAPEPLLYLAGEDRAGDVAGALAAHGLPVEIVVVYRAALRAECSHDLRAALAAGVEGVLHYSRRSTQAFVEAARAGGLLEPALHPMHYCLSGQVAAPLREAGAARIAVAARPDEAALMALLP